MVALGLCHLMGVLYPWPAGLSGFSLWCHLLSWGTAWLLAVEPPLVVGHSPRRSGSAGAACGFCRSVAGGPFPDRGSDPHWPADSYPPYHQGRPEILTSNYQLVLIHGSINWYNLLLPLGPSPVAQLIKNLPAMRETWVWSPGWEDPLEKEMAVLLYPVLFYSAPVLLPGKCHGWRSVVGYSPWDRKESDTTKQLHCSLQTI